MPKTEIKEQDPKVRGKNFDEVCQGYTDEEAIKEANRCIECGKCIPGCPVNIDIPRFIHAIKEKEFEKACDIIKESNNLPAVCGRVCPQEDQCEKLCVIGIKDEPVAIGKLERFAAEHDNQKIDGVEAIQKKVAVIGSGPAGLTCAAQLAKKGIEVTIFEALHKAGGVLQYGIPAFRLPRDVLKLEIDFVEKLGVKIELDSVVGLAPYFERLKTDFDAVFIGSGAGLPYFLGVEGESLNGVYSANEFLIRINLMHADQFPKYDTPVGLGENLIVIGGGNVAMDCARAGLRAGAKKVTVIYRRTKNEMPARDEEIEHAFEEGIDFQFLTNPQKFIGEGKVQEVECIRMELGEPDDSGRRRPVPIEGSEFTIPADTVVVAIGQGPNPLLLDRVEGLEMTKRGRIKINEDLLTSVKGVFAGGDIASNDATVISAMAQGKAAAANIIKFIGKK